MAFKHLFKVSLKWQAQKHQRYTKNHSISIEQKEILNISAAKAFKGDPSRYNPEDLLLSSLVSCHMMSYLYVCGQNGIDVLTYTDDAEATLEVTAEGSGRFVAVRLFPKVAIRQMDKIELAHQLHKKANQLCFIANSCNFPIEHFPEIMVANE
ncbi:OsmC family protein [Flavobacterium sp. NG2]|uniref:OsmC family protein n=1 Tax=Flavobacterium sp. NG2 TaxID=3097547 RepID=UPI002A81293D|nr:OsmC family protein [Flavobacterium sp. NG2]WPR71346.1 OsmC family protein [Flavobacterium sp. NG2]